MNKMNPEQLSFAVAMLDRLRTSRGFSHTDLATQSGISQGTISRILSRTQEPAEETLESLFEAVGTKVDAVLDAWNMDAKTITGYLATPLTGVVGDPQKEKELIRIVDDLTKIAASPDFTNPSIGLYWPGRFTHPLKNANVASKDVYLLDRSRASSYHFVVIFCADPSYGVGQENEIATQAGRPAIRLIPEKISRMMSGSFLQANDVFYSGSLSRAMNYDRSTFHSALAEIRKLYFRHIALYKDLEKNGFSARLKELVDDRVGNYQQFADDLGIGLSYVHALMNEPILVSNPSAILLQRISARLCVSIGFLLGEAPEVDAIWNESRLNWHKWLESQRNIDGKVANEIFTDWRKEYQDTKNLATLKSFRAIESALTVVDWDRRYKTTESKNGNQESFFETV